MTKKDKNTLGNFFGLVLFLLGLYFWYKFSLGVVSFFVILIITATVPHFIISLIIPDKQTNKKTKKTNTSTQNKTTANKNTSNKKTTSEKTQNKKLNDKDLLIADIDSLSGENFEKLVYLYFKDKGFKPETTPKSGDHGVDLVITAPEDGYKIAVQCKRYVSTKTIGNNDLIKLEGGKKFYHCSGTLFITTSSYTRKAKEFAESCKMETWNRLHVFDKIDKWRKDKYKKIS